MCVLIVNGYFLLWIILSISVQADEFVLEYFLYKGVGRVTAFSCEKIDDDFRFVRKMHELGIFAGVIRPNLESYNIPFERIPRTDFKPIGIFLDTRCQSQEVNEKIIAQSTNNQLYDTIHIWLIIGSSLPEIIEMLNDNAYSLRTDLTIGVETTLGYDLYDVYNPCRLRGGNLNVTELGSWNENNGFNITLTQLKFRRRSNLHGMQIKAITVVKYQPPGMDIIDYLEDYKTKSLDHLSKYGWGIAQLMADLYNYTMEIQTVDEWLTTVNGTEEGMMPRLYRGEGDLGISPCSPLLVYVEKPYARMITPACPFRTFFIFRSNEVKTFKWMELMTPFAFDSWYVTFLMAIFSTAIITTIQVTEFREGWFVESGHAIFATVSVLCLQGLTFVPNRFSGRIAFLFILFFGVLLYNYYGASVVSARLNEPQDKMNDSLYSLAKSHMTVASEPFRFIDVNLALQARYSWEVRYFLENVWSKLSESKFVPLKDGLEKVASGGYAYHTTPEVAYPYVEENWDDKAICDMTEVHVLKPRMLVFWDRLDSPFTELIKNGLIQTANTGLRRRTINRWKPKTPYCSEDSRSLESITIFDVAPAVIVVLFGAVLAAIICIGERIMFKLHPKNITEPSHKKKQRLGGKRALIRVKKN